jgi:taurine--2-oxoglutarate transaminase
MGALSLSGDHRRPPLEPGLVGVTHVLDCFESRLPGGARVIEGGGSADALSRTLSLEGSKSIAAVFLEPVPGANGVLVPPAGYWDAVRAACDREGTLLVADCVLDGFGRLGTYYGFEAVGSAAPDLITISKGLTGGYAPLGAVLVHERIAQHFEEHVLWAGLTFYGHPLGVAAGLAAVKAYDDEQLIPRAAQLGKKLEAALFAIQDRHPARFPKARCLGMLGALELAVDGAELARIEQAVEREHLMVHFNPRYATVIVSPPLVIEEAELDDGMHRLEAALTR